jgi:hypothetical protein
MRDNAFQGWRRECEAIEQEMDHLVRAGMPASVEERQVRRIRFTALVERREAAARKLIEADRVRHQNWRKGKPGPGDHLISVANAGPLAEADSAAFVSLPDGRRKADVQSELSPHSPAISTPATPSAVVAPAPSDPALGPDSARTTAVDPLADPAQLTAHSIPISPDSAPLPNRTPEVADAAPSDTRSPDPTYGY